MAQLSGMQIGTQARALAVALALGAVVLSLTPGQTAYAARGTSNEAGETAPDDGDGNGSSARKNVNDYPKCTITTSDGTIHFYVPGDKVVVGTKYGDRHMICGSDGEWIVMRPGAADVPPGGGLGTNAP